MNTVDRVIIGTITHYTVIFVIIGIMGLFIGKLIIFNPGNPIWLSAVGGIFLVSAVPIIKLIDKKISKWIN